MLKIDAKEAFEKFSGKYLDPGDAGKCSCSSLMTALFKTRAVLTLIQTMYFIFL